ncbi:MAG: hypothetical protein IME98_01285 [Proteobacteria bacterium]|nr:hypothetical protein [Pseudomonadota bacterium]
MRSLVKYMVSPLFVAAFFIVFALHFGAGTALSAPLSGDGTGGASELCLFSEESGAELHLEILDNDFVVGDFCIDGCGCGTLLGEAHIAGADGLGYGTIDLYADLSEVCAYGVWYSIDMPSLSHIWHYTGLESTRYSGTGIFKEIACETSR